MNANFCIFINLGKTIEFPQTGVWGDLNMILKDNVSPIGIWFCNLIMKGNTSDKNNYLRVRLHKR